MSTLRSPAILDISAANCRQLLHRAKQHVAEQRPRFSPWRRSASGSSWRASWRRRSKATFESLTQMLAEDVIFLGR